MKAEELKKLIAEYDEAARKCREALRRPRSCVPDADGNTAVEREFKALSDKGYALSMYILDHCDEIAAALERDEQRKEQTR